MREQGLDFTGKTVIITGGGTGIGKIYSQAFAAAGANVVIADIAGEEGEQVAKEINDGGGSALAVRTDISVEDDTLAMARAAMDKFGSIDVLVNNASLMSALPRQPWPQIEVDDWDRVMEVNLRGMFLCCRAVYPQMREQQKGKIINISSSRVWSGIPNRLHYTTSKAGVIGLTRALSREVGDDNINVNAITPGFTESETQMAGSTPEYIEARTKMYQKRSFKRGQMQDDLVGAVILLSSEDSDFITGQTLNIDGGESTH